MKPQVNKSLVTISAVLLQLVLAQVAFAAISVSSDHPKQGQTVEVSVDDLTDSPELPKLEFNNQKFALFPNAEPGKPKYVVLLAVPADLKPGVYRLRVQQQDKNIVVSDGRFVIQSITLPKSKDNFIESKGEKEAIENAKAALSPNRLWQGVFVPPSSARMSAGFGMRRYVNGRLLKDYFHTGMDYAGALGSPVKAVANGKVVLTAHDFRLHGNVIAIDHGQGVVSIYIHLNNILVKNGQEVKEGQIIGKVGQTGRANGPHLHFGLYVNQVAANPMYWYSHAF